MSTAHDETLAKMLKSYQDEGMGAEWKLVDSFFGFLRRKTNLLSSGDAVKRTQSIALKHVEAAQQEAAKRQKVEKQQEEEKKKAALAAEKAAAEKKAAPAKVEGNEGKAPPEDDKESDDKEGVFTLDPVVAP